jgi:hypothetical protein
MLDLDPGAPMLAMRMDTALAGFRALMEKAIESEQSYAAQSAASVA